MSSRTNVRKSEPISHKENKMSTNLNFRKSLIVTLAVVVFLMAAAVLLSSRMETANGNASAIAAQTGGYPGGRYIDMPRVRFAALEGRKTPASLDGRKSPASLDGRRTPASLDGRKSPVALEGKKIPPAALAAPIASQAASLTLIDGMIILALAALLIVPVRKNSTVRKNSPAGN